MQDQTPTVEVVERGIPERRAQKSVRRRELAEQRRQLQRRGAPKAKIDAITAEIERVKHEGASSQEWTSSITSKDHTEIAQFNFSASAKPLRTAVLLTRGEHIPAADVTMGKVAVFTPKQRRPVSQKRPVTRTRGSRRPRAQATRSSAASGDSGSDDPDPEPAGDGERVERLCRLCKRDISHLTGRGQTCGACRMQKSRKRKLAEKPRNICRDHSDASNPVVDAVLATCGNWPDSSRADRARLIQHAANLGISITDSQAGQLIDGCYRLSPREKLIKLAAAVREKRRADRESELGELVDLHAFRRRHERFVNSLSTVRLAVAA